MSQYSYRTYTHCIVSLHPIRLHHLD
jgi:hypothetical protein